MQRVTSLLDLHQEVQTRTGVQQEASLHTGLNMVIGMQEMPLSQGGMQKESLLFMRNVLVAKKRQPRQASDFPLLLLTPSHAKARPMSGWMRPSQRDRNPRGLSAHRLGARLGYRALRGSGHELTGGLRKRTRC